MHKNIAGLSVVGGARLAGILGLLSSDNPGERDAGAHAVARFMRSRDLQWVDIIGTPTPQQLCNDNWSVLADWPVHWRRAVHTCLREPGLLSDWHRRFLTTVAAYKHQPSVRQLHVLATITTITAAVLAAGGGK